MTATLTIRISPVILRALGSSQSVAVVAGLPGAAPRGADLRTGSLAAKLVAWVAERPGPIGVPDVMKALRIDRRRATGALAQAEKAGRLRRVRHGTYARAGAADVDRFPGVSFRAGSLPARLVAWARRRKRAFRAKEVVKALRITPAHASMVLTQVTRSGDVKRVEPGVYAAA